MPAGTLDHAAPTAGLIRAAGGRAAGPMAAAGTFGLVLAILAIYIVLKPFYFTKSGYPQIADGVLCFGALAALALPRSPFTLSARDALRSIGLFVGYAAAVNILWAAILLDLSMVATSAFYVFNFLLFLICLKLFAIDRDRSFRWLCYAITFSAGMLTLVSILVVNVGSARQNLFFNNPNQLGYWALLSLSLFLVCQTQIRLSIYVQTGTALCLTFLAALSLSKSSILSIAMLLCIHFVRNPRFFLGVFFVSAMVLLFSSTPEVVDRVADRIGAIGDQTDDTAEGRGYTRIIDYPQYLLFGAGEFGFDRFVRVTYELHSTFGTILFSYGVIGSALFTICMWMLLRHSGRRHFMYLLPAFLYGIAHQGLRFSFLWLLFAAVAAAAPLASQRSVPTGAEAGGAVAAGRSPAMPRAPMRAAPAWHRRYRRT